MSTLGLVMLIALMDWVPTPLNRNIASMTRRERLPSTAIHGVTGLGFAVADLMAIHWVILAGAVWFTGVLSAAIRNWWAPYLLGTAPGEISAEAFARDYAGNLRILPVRPNRPITPDLQHSLIHAALLATVILTWWAFVVT